MDDLGQKEGIERCDFRGLEDNRATCRQRRCDFCCNLMQRVDPGVMATTTPAGSRTTLEWPTCSSNGKSPNILAYMPKVAVGEPTWMRCDSL